MKDLLLAAWRYRVFILSSIRNDFKARFARSLLGGLWMILNPLALVAMYAIVLSAVMSAKHPTIDNRFAYANYLSAGILAWTLFTETISRCLNIFIENGNLMKKMVFPRICLPLIVSGSVLFNSLLLLISISIIFCALGNIPNQTYLWLPLLLFITLAFGLSIGLILGVFNVFIRDIEQIVPIILQFWFWFTPIVYFQDSIPDSFKWMMRYNPMMHITGGFQSILLYGEAPRWGGVAVIGGLSLLLLACALLLFRKASPEMVDVL